MTQKEKPLDRGDLIVIDFDPQAGTEIMKSLPALVISPKIYNEKSTKIICCPITSTVKLHDPWQVVLPKDSRIKGALVPTEKRQDRKECPVLRLGKGKLFFRGLLTLNMSQFVQFSFSELSLPFNVYMLCNSAIPSLRNRLDIPPMSSLF